MQEVTRHVVLAHCVLDNLEDIAVDEVQTREVQRDRHRRQPCLPDARLIAADLLNEEGIELVDEVVLFEDANKEWRRQEPPVRIIPAREAFHRAELPRDRAHDGLVVNPYPVLLNGLVEVLDDIGWRHINLPSLLPHLIVTNS